LHEDGQRSDRTWPTLHLPRLGRRGDRYPREVAEMALVHAISDQVEATYRRGDLFDKRREMMTEWCAVQQST
jgi:hypothetical protein